ncbi:hypothetical protein GCM10023324_31430 [Streptomyces youssoufiensis]
METRQSTRGFSVRPTTTRSDPVVSTRVGGDGQRGAAGRVGARHVAEVEVEVEIEVGEDVAVHHQEVSGQLIEHAQQRAHGAQRAVLAAVADARAPLGAVADAGADGVPEVAAGQRAA